MKRTFSKLFAAGLISTVAGLSIGSSSATAETKQFPQASGSVFQSGETQGAIHVITGDNLSWTKIKPGFGYVDFPVMLAANANPGGHGLSHVWAIQGNVLNVKEALYDSGSLDTVLEHDHTGTLTGGSLKLSAQEKAQIIAQCNANLNQLSQQQSQQEFDFDIPLTMVMQTVQPEGTIVSEGLDWQEDNVTTNFPVKIICEPFTKETPPLPSDEAADLGNSNITQVELGLTTTGPLVGGTLEYTGSCPMGITLNMRWVTNIGADLKTYIKHKDLAGQHNWTSPTFNVTTNLPAAGGHWKKEMTDLISIPFAGAVPTNGGGGVAGGNNPGGLGFNPGGGGGSNPASGFGATNTGTNNGLTQYIGYFQLVAYKKKKVVPVLLQGGGLSNTTIYEGQKISGWRKYIVTCEPQQNTGIPQIPGGVTNPDNGPVNPDDPLNIPVVQYDGELDLADSADVPQCSRQGQAVFKINSSSSSPVNYKLTCTGGRSWQGSVQMFANGVNKYQGVAAKTFDITKTENIACVLNRVLGGNNHPLAIRAKQYNCIKRNVVTGANDLQVEPKPDTTTPFLPGVVTTGQIDKKAADIARKRKVEARRKAAKAAIAAKRKAAAAALAKRRAVAVAHAKRRAVAVAHAKRRAVAVAHVKRKAVAAALARRKAVAAALSRKRAAAAAKRRTIAPVRVKRFRAR